MRLTDLLGKPVAGPTGQTAMHCQDVRLVQDGPILGSWGAAFAIEGFIIGKRRLGERFGFHRTTMTGPWPLKPLFEWYHRDARFLPWDLVESIEGGVIVARVALEQLPGVEPISE